MSNNEVREASGVIPFRWKLKHGLEVLVVRSTNKGAWTFPKGGVEPHLNDKQNAVKEAYEEAGVIGVIGEYLGRYSYTKGGVKQQVRMFSMEVAHELLEDEYPEGDIRDRMWCSFAEAEKLVSKDNRKMLLELHRQYYA